MSTESRLDEIVRTLGRYYGSISRSDFTARILQGRPASSTATATSPTSSAAPSGVLEIPTTPPTPAQRAAAAFLDITEGGYTTPDLIRMIESYASGGGGGGPNDIGGLIRICYEPTPNISPNTGIVLNETTRPRIGVPGASAGSEPRQGYAPPGSTDPYSIKHISGADIGATGATSDTNTGGNTTSFSVSQVYSNMLSPSSRDMGAITLFMNAIPTIEMSRAVPFIDMTLIQEGDHFDASNRLNSLSLGQFFLGNKVVPPNTTARNIMGANDFLVTEENRRDREFERNGTASPISTAGMELFTSPQTLVNANESHRENGDLTTGAAASEEILRRQSPVIDKFRPLMTLKSLSFSVSGTGGMMSYKSGKMSITLHDRSRLAEVSALVRPSRFGTTHLLIEYGWSHPDAPVHAALGSVNPNNLFGSLIGALRVKEKYNVVNSTFDFDDAGQVNIELTISMLSNRAASRVHVGLEFDNIDAFNEVRNLTNAISAIRGRLSPTTAESLFGEADPIGALSDPASVLSGLDADTVRAIRRIADAANRRGQSADLRELGRSLENLLGEGNRNNGGPIAGAASRLRNGMEQRISQKIGQMKSLPDPFLVPNVGPEGRRPSTPRNARERLDTHMSLGKIFSTFVAAPIVASGQYADVQIVFYNFNDKASWMANRNIATFPIKTSDFEDILKRELSQLLNMSVEIFTNLLGTYFISDPSSEAYGFSNLYNTRRDEDGTRQLKDQYDDEEESAALFQVQQAELRRAYGLTAADDNTEGSDLEFRQPTITIVTEAVQALKPDTGRPDPDNPGKTILRMHIFDAQATSHRSLQEFLEAASSASVGLVNAGALAARDQLNAIVSPASTSTGTDVRNAASSTLENIRTALRDGLIEQFPSSSAEINSAADLVNRRFRIVGGFPKLKQFLMKTVPSMRYGEGTSGIISAKVNSMSDPALTTVSMQRQASSPEAPTHSRSQGLPLVVAPVECSIETIGCPLWSFGQQVFIDFGTGTTIDAIYGVTGVEHTIEPGNFKSTVKLTPMNSYARYTSLVTNIENMLIAIEGIEGISGGIDRAAAARDTAAARAASAPRPRRAAGRGGRPRPAGGSTTGGSGGAGGSGAGGAASGG